LLEEHDLGYEAVLHGQMDLAKVERIHLWIEEIQAAPKLPRSKRGSYPFVDCSVLGADVTA